MVKIIDAQTVDAPPSGWEEVVVQNPTGIGTLQFQMKKVYPKPPHIVEDNHFSGEEVMKLLGSKGYGATMTNRRDRFPEGLKPYLHHEGVKSGCPKARAMRFDNPIVAIKQVPAVEDEDGSIKAKACTRTLVSFQSTGPTNICGVNNLPSVSLYVSKRVRGKGAATRMWGIEQNEARATYLGHYYGVDNVDHMIKNAKIRYTTWKYWHAPFFHALSMSMIVAYDMYIECCEGGLDSEWFVEAKDRMTFRDFRLLLSEQMMTYDPRAQLYHGDENFRKVTRLGKRKKKGTILEGGKGWSKFGKLQNCKDFELPFAFASLWPVR